MPLVIGHRGASADYPENTLEAFRGASAQGADWVELDVRRTADGELVVCHDPSVAAGAIASLPRSELADSIPSLADALAACMGMGVNVEIKNDPAEPGFDPSGALVAATLEVIADAGRGEILVSSFDLATIDAVKVADPTMPTGFLVLDPGHPIAAAGGADAVVTAVDRGHEAVHPWNPCTTEAFVAAAQGAGLAVNVWTVDDPERIRQLAGWGVDGIITNRPAETRRVLAG